MSEHERRPAPRKAPGMRIATLRALLGRRDYVVYSAGNAVSLIGTWIQAIAFGWTAWSMTESPLWLGVVSAAGLIPTILAGLAGGVLADSLDRLKLTLLTQGASFLLTITLFALYRMEALNIGLLVVFKGLLAGITALSQPARMALVPQLVGPGLIGPAVSFSSMTFNTARFIGPAVAGLILVVWDAGAAFLINALTFLVMAAAILMLRLPKHATRPAARPASEEGVANRLRAGWRHVATHPGALALFLMLVVVVLTVRPVSDFLPALVSRIHGRGVEAVAALTSSLALGSLLGGLWTAGRPLNGMTASTLKAAFLYALCVAAFILTPNFWIGCLILTAAGAFTAVFSISAQTLVQTSTPDAMRGRVMSLWFILVRGGPDLGALLIGLSAARLGLHAAFLGGAALCLGATAWAWFRLSRLTPELEQEAPSR
ncbi:MFS transporter [Brevundimonas faecalis]|uniref:MFS transporter n=1 Tax=Brevundimonas faecalis TaxID=947378 RepID=UPI00360737A3